MIVAMVWVALFIIIILLIKPYIRKSDDRLHLYSNSVILLLVMAGNIFNHLGDGDEKTDAALTAVLIGIVIVFTGFVLLQAILVGRKAFRAHLAKKSLEKSKQKSLEENESDKIEWNEGSSNNLTELNKITADLRVLFAEEELEAKEERKQRKKYEDYSDVLPIIQRAELKPKARELIGENSNAKSALMKYNPLWGADGNEAVYDPTSDELIDSIQNPMYKKSEEEKEKEEKLAKIKDIPSKVVLKKKNRLSALFSRKEAQPTPEEVANENPAFSVEMLEMENRRVSMKFDTPLPTTNEGISDNKPTGPVRLEEYVYPAHMTMRKKKKKMDADDDDD